MNQKLLRILALITLLAMVFSGCGGRRTSQEKRTSNRRGGRRGQTVETTPRETAPPAPSIPPPPPPTEPEPSYAPAPVPTEPERKGPLIYGEDGQCYVPEHPDLENMRFKWNSANDLGEYWITFNVDKNMYKFYRSADRIWGVENYYKYINDPNNHALIQDVISGIRKATESQKLSDSAVAREIAAFVQDAIEYEYDIDSAGMDEYPRYPVETLYERRGDCEDTSILMAALLKEWGYEVALIHLPGHLAVAIRTSDDYGGGSYYEYNGHRYLYIESTGSGFKIGEIPKEEMNVSAEFHIVP